MSDDLATDNSISSEGLLPQLVKHDGWDYHLHATSPEAPPPSLIFSTLEPGPIGSACLPIEGGVPCPGSMQIRGGGEPTITTPASPPLGRSPDTGLRSPIW